MILFETAAVYTVAEEHTHQRFQFAVPRGLTQLVVRFQFSPFDGGDNGLDEIKATLKADAPYYEYSDAEARRFLPLHNHFGLSIDTPNGWNGTAHRHDPDQRHIINNQKSSDGFFATDIIEGDWGVTLSLNAVVTPTVSIRLVVEGE